MTSRGETATVHERHAGVPPGSGSAGRVTIPLTDNWDASLSYDLLEHDARPESAIFVGRDELLGPIVDAIGRPDRRGTYLVSGYRGAGKTTLVIEAARRAREKLEGERWKLLPIVLNVSEVSASLSDAAEAEAAPLQIDARRLLTALLRALRNKLHDLQRAGHLDGGREDVAGEVERVLGKAAVGNALASLVRASRNGGRRPTTSNGTELLELAAKIDAAYKKAAASQYSETSRQGVESTLRKTVESKLSLDAPNVLKLAAGLAAIGAAAIEGWFLFWPGGGAVHALALALAGAAVVSFGASRTMSSSTATNESSAIELVTDNSIHQLENDLKDIFAQLKGRKLRTVVVLEELDKVDDAEGRQLDAVIRYFKNLFTQAPALFFFLTDKQYYDLIASKIEDARSRRTYSVEHTFFTHRVFVNRPSAADCLEYLRTVAVEPADKDAIAAISAADADRVRDLESMDARERLFRVILFRAQDHLFDLKNELRRYVRVDNGAPRIEFDDESLPPNEQATAAFQFLLEQNARAHGFRGGGEYANEVLRNCLFSVFARPEPGEPRSLADFHPLQGEDGDQLSPNEERRIRDAIAALVEDLERGGAVERDPAQATITWFENAAVRFKPTAVPQPQEKDLSENLQRHASALWALADGGPLRTVDPSGAASGLVAELNERLGEIGRTRTPLAVEEATAIASRIEAESTRVLGAAFEEHRLRLTERLGRELVPVETAGSGTAWELTGLAPDALEDHVLLVYGTDERIRQFVRAFVAGHTGSRYAIVNVVAVASDAQLDGERLRLVQDWKSLLGPDVAASAAFGVVSLHEGLTPRDVDARWTEATADELLLAQLWVEKPALRGANPPVVASSRPGPYVLRSSAGAEFTYASLDDAVLAWLRSSDRVLCRAPPWPEFGAVAAVLSAPVDIGGRLLAYLPADAAVPGSAASLWPGLPPADLHARDESLRRLVETDRVVLGVDANALRRLRAGTRLPAAARVDLHELDLNGPRRHVEAVTAAGGITLLRAESEPAEAYDLSLLVAGLNADEAEALLRIAAEGDHPPALRHLAHVLNDDQPEEARQWRDRLVSMGAWPEVEKLANALGGRDVIAVRELYTDAAQGGSPSAMRWLALNAENLEAAQSWRERLVATGSSMEILQLAEALRESDPAAARTLYENAAERGSTAAQGHLVLDLLEREPEQARSWADRLLASGALFEVRRVAEIVFRRKPEEAQEWAVLAGMADKSAEVRQAVADLIRPIDSKLAESLLAHDDPQAAT